MSSQSEVDNLRGRGVIVTGGAGFIGTHLIKRLVQRGARVFCVDQTSTSFAEQGVQVRSCDLTQAGQVARVFASINQEVPVELVFHLAAQNSIPKSLASPIETFRINVDGTAHALEASLGCSHLRHFFLLSTYGLRNLVDDGKGMDSPYLMSKLCAEEIALSYAKSGSLPVSVCRLANVYGPHQPVDAVVPSIIRQAYSKDSIHIGNATPVRDFVFIADVIDALIKLSETPKTYGRMIEIGTGRGHSIQDVVDLVVQISRFKGKVVSDKRRIRSNDQNTLTADTSRIQNELGWYPQMTLEQGLQAVVGEMYPNR